MWSPPGVDPGTAARAVAVLLVASLAGRAFQRLRLPRISGYLLTGAALGPRALAVLGETHAARLAATDAMCLAVIGIAAGAELEPSAVRQSGRVIGHLAVANCASALAFVFCCSYVFIGPSASIGLAAGDRLAAASLLSSVVAIARSPSSAIALVAELRADGPFTQTLLGVTMVTELGDCMDFLVMPCRAAASAR